MNCPQHRQRGLVSTLQGAGAGRAVPGLRILCGSAPLHPKGWTPNARDFYALPSHGSWLSSAAPAPALWGSALAFCASDLRSDPEKAAAAGQKGIAFPLKAGAVRQEAVEGWRKAAVVWEKGIAWRKKAVADCQKVATGAGKAVSFNQ